MSDIELDYDSLMQDALKRVVHDVLDITAELKETPGDHHFYIEFLTGAPGVKIPSHLRESYPTRMTIVLHHQFENLEVFDHLFKVTLWFKGVEAHLEIPFDSMTSFADPGAKFGLRFHEEEDGTHSSESTGQTGTITSFSTPQDTSPYQKSSSEADAAENTNGGENEDTQGEENNETSADIVSLDSFRRK